jgi:hypothetical protein
MNRRLMATPEEVAEQFRKEMESLMPKFDKSEKKSSIGVGVVAWVILLLLGCAVAWIIGAIIAFGVNGYHIVSKLIG